MQPLLQVGLFLTHICFDLFIIVLMLRFLLQYFQMSYHHPLTQGVLKLTSFMVIPLRRIIPSLWGLDLATLVAVFLITLIKSLVYFSLARIPLAPQNFIFYTLITLIDLSISLFFYAILLRVIVSWATPFSQSPMVSFVYQLTEPLLKRARRLLPAAGGFDFSPLVVSIGLLALKILMTGYLYQIGKYVGISF